MRRPRVILAASFAGLVACGPIAPDAQADQVELVVTPSASAQLTAKPGDVLFTLALAKAPRAYALTDISVVGQLPGQTATMLEFRHADANKDGLLDAGETLEVSEPPVNLFDETTRGTAVVVSFSEKKNGTWWQRGSTTWKP